MNRNAKGLGFYLIVVLLILLLLTYFRGGLEASQSWNYDQLEEAITQEEVVKVEITPNQEVPTGSLKVLLSDGNVKYVNVTDITKAESELREHESMGVLVPDQIPELGRRMAASARFSGLLLCGYENKIDDETQTQFSALTLLLPDGTAYVAFRGTDDTIVGWKEDFNLAFLPVVPAQRMAVQYLQAAAAAFSERPLRVGGHSKGGNLAVYSAVFCSEAVQNQLMQVYNNDGPGFRTSLLPLPEHKRVAGRIVTIIPESSVVGILLEHEERCEVVRSTQIGLMQHDGFSWQVRGERFEHLPDRTEGGKLVDETLRAFIVSLSDEQRVAFIDALFDILTCTDADTLTDLKEGGLRTAAAMVRKYRTLDKDTRQALGSTLRLFMKAGAKTAASELNPVQLLLRHLPLQKLAEGLESQEPADVPEK